MGAVDGPSLASDTLSTPSTTPPPTPLTNVIIYATSLVFIMVFAWVANTVALFTILRVQSLRQTPHNMLILNLAVADLGRALIVMPLYLKSVLDDGIYLMKHDVACKTVGFFSEMLLYINCMTIAFIAIDRVIVVTSCTKCRISDWTRVRVMVLFIWLIAGAFALFPTIMDKEALPATRYIEAWRMCGTYSEYAFSILALVVKLGIVFPTMVVSYTIIAVLLWKRNRKLTRRRRGGLRATVVTKPTRPIPTSPVGLRKVTFDMRCTEPEDQVTDPQNNEEKTSTECRYRNGCISTPKVNSSERTSQENNALNVELNVETYDMSFPRKRQQPEVTKRNRKCVSPVGQCDDGNLPAQSAPPVAPTRYGLGARLSLLLNIKTEHVFKDEYREGEQDNCVIKGFKSANGTGFTPGTSMNSIGTGNEDPDSTTYRTVIETNTRRLSSLFGSLKGIVGLGHYGREGDDDDDENDSEQDDEQTCDPDSEPSQTLTTYSMSPSIADITHGTDDEDVEGVVRTPKTRSRRRRRKRTRKSRLEKLRHIRQRRVALTGVLLVCCNICFTVPLTILRFIANDLTPEALDVFGVLAYWLTYSISIADPLVYAFMNRRVKKELRMYRKVIAKRLFCRE